MTLLSPTTPPTMNQWEGSRGLHGYRVTFQLNTTKTGLVRTARDNAIDTYLKDLVYCTNTPTVILLYHGLVKSKECQMLHKASGYSAPVQ